MYYFDYSQFDYGAFTYRPYSLYHEGSASLAGKGTLTAQSKVNQYVRASLNSGANITCNTVVRGRCRGSASIECVSFINANSKVRTLLKANTSLSITSELACNAVLKHHAHVTLSGNSSLTSNARWVFVKRSDGEIKASSGLTANAKLYTIVRAGSNIQCQTSLNTTSMVKTYGYCAVAGAAYVEASSISKVMAGINISGHADVTMDEIIRAFEEAKINAGARINTNGIIRKWGSANIISTAQLRGNAIVAIYANVIINAGAEIEASSKKAILTGLNDAPVSFFAMNDKCYILTGNEYIVYDGNRASPVIGYVPTINQSRTPDGIGGTAYQELNYLSDSWKESFSGTADATEYKLELPGLLGIKADSIEKVWVNREELIAGFMLGADGLTVTFDVSPGEGDNNVVIQATMAGLNDPTSITQCTIAQEWGGKNDTRVFLSGNPNISNRRWYSQVREGGILDPTYFKVNDYDDIGSNAEAVTGFGRVVDYQVVYKERTTYYSSVVGPDDAGFMSFPVLPMNDEYGCIAPRTVCPAQGGLLALSEQGVTFTIPSFVRGQLNVVLVSEKVNHDWDSLTGIQDFTIAERKAAHAYIYDQKYWLHIKDRVWVLDLRYSSLAQGVYCWYPFTQIPGKASCFLESGENLYVGDNVAGLIYRRYPGRYSDDAEPIDAWWKSPLLFMGIRGWIKKFLYTKITFGADQISDHTLSFITDEDTEDIPIRQEAGLFRYVNHSYKYFTYGVFNREYPSIQPEKAGIKGEYLQLKISNDSNRGMALAAVSVTYQVKKEVR